MKKNLKPLATLLVLATVMGTSIHANERLYVQSPNGTVQSFALDDLKKITFTETDMSFHAMNGNITSLLFDDVSAWTFEPLGMVVLPVTAESVKVYLNAGCVVVESPANISAVSLYNLQGALLQHTAKAILPVSALPAGLYIVRVADRQGNASVHKILKP
jgi:hypothetical protein